MTLKLERLDTHQIIELPEDLRWTDEYGWNAVAQSAPERTLTGSIVIQQGLKQKGRPITLSGEWVWLDLATVRTLRDWTDVPELTMKYTHYDGREFNVVFALHNTALKAEPVHFSTPEADGERYTAEIALITI